MKKRHALIYFFSPSEFFYAVEMKCVSFISLFVCDDLNTKLEGTLKFNFILFPQVFLKNHILKTIFSSNFVISLPINRLMCFHGFPNQLWFRKSIELSKFTKRFAAPFYRRSCTKHKAFRKVSNLFIFYYSDIKRN